MKHFLLIGALLVVTMWTTSSHVLAYDVYRDIDQDTEADYEAGRYDEAIARLKIALAGMSYDDSHWGGFTLRLAYCYEGTGQWSKAADEWLDMLKELSRYQKVLTPGTALRESVRLGYQANVARCLLLEGNAKLAEDTLKGTPEQAEEDYKALAKRIAEGKGEPPADTTVAGLSPGLQEVLRKEAKATAEQDARALGRFPDAVARAYLTRAVILSRLKREAEARAAAVKAASVHPKGAGSLQASYLLNARDQVTRKCYNMALFYYEAAGLVAGKESAEAISKEADGIRAKVLQAVDGPSRVP